MRCLCLTFLSDGTGTYAITEHYAAKCGYSVSILSLLGLVELRASYFSCHTEKVPKETSFPDLLEEVTCASWLIFTTLFQGADFSFRFNLITSYKGVDAYYALNKTCSSPLPWSPREVTCEVNYMEVCLPPSVPLSLSPHPSFF